MKSSFKVRAQYAAAAVLTALLFCTPAVAQPARAEALFTEAKLLAASADTNEKLDAVFAKFDEAASLFRAAGNEAKADEVELEHGRSLRALAVRELNASRYAEAIQFYERALKKMRAVGNSQEIGYINHDLGYISELKGNPADAMAFYSKARDAYHDAGDHKNEAAVIRFLGVLSATAEKYSDAIAYFETALKIPDAVADPFLHPLLLMSLGRAYRSTEKNAEAIAKFDEALSIYIANKDRLGEASARFRLGDAQSALFKYAEASQNLTAAQNIFAAEKKYAEEAGAAEALGEMLMTYGKYAEAEPNMSLAAGIYRIIDDQASEAFAQLDLTIIYQSLGRLDDAQSAVERARSIFVGRKNRIGEAYALIIHASLLNYFNRHDEALAKIYGARDIFREQKVTSGDYRVAAALQNHYHSLSNYGEAIRYGLEALAIALREKDVYREASMYVELANAYSSLGQQEKAIEYTNKALVIAEEVQNPYMVSISLSNLGYYNLCLEKLPEAKANFEKAITMMRANGYVREEGYATHNLGLLFYKRKQYQFALANYDRARELYLKAGDRRPQAFLYDSLGELYRDLGQYDKAVDNLQKAVVLAREIKYSEVEARALGNMMTLWTRRNQPRLAVLYGKQAVNVYQTIRAGNATLDTAAQKSFVQSNEKTYRQLANVLIDEGRLAEAQQVLDLLKAEEYFEFVRRDSGEASDTAALALSESERNALEEYSRVSNTLTALGVEYQKLQDERNKSGGKLDAAKEAEYLRVKNQVEMAAEGLKAFFAKLASEFSKKVEDGTVVTPQSIETLKADLRRAGPDVVLVSTYLLPERYRAIVTTGRTMVDRKVEYSAIKLTGADVNRKIFEFQRALQNPNVDPRKLGKELYDIFVKPLENDLRGAGAKTILWSLDGSLRYIPLAALSPDGKTYLAERYQNVIVTLGRQTNLFAKPSGEEWRAIGAGVSKPHTGFSALPSVPEEIGSIVRDAKATSGILDGTRMLDEQFNLESLRNTMPQQTEDGKTFNVLHLATHFSLGANDQDSALLLGDGTRLSLFDIGKDEALDFKDVELLTLSACQTGVSTGDANGREVESLGMLAQKKGAKAVLATLWKVADESTSLFMTEFYRIKKANPTMNKAEAIRLAQKEMIDGKIKASGKSNGCRAESFSSGAKKDEFKCDPNAPFSHPYFWSPFVLIGNWR